MSAEDRGQRLRVLLVDDDALARKVCGRLLGKSFDITDADSGQAALLVLKRSALRRGAQRLPHAVDDGRRTARTGARAGTARAARVDVRRRRFRSAGTPGLRRGAGVSRQAVRCATCGTSARLHPAPRRLGTPRSPNFAASRTGGTEWTRKGEHGQKAFSVLVQARRLVRHRGADLRQGRRPRRQRRAARAPRPAVVAVAVRRGRRCSCARSPAASCAGTGCSPARASTRRSGTCSARS